MASRTPRSVRSTQRSFLSKVKQRNCGKRSTLYCRNIAISPTTLPRACFPSSWCNRLFATVTRACNGQKPPVVGLPDSSFRLYPVTSHFDLRAMARNTLAPSASGPLGMPLLN